MLSMFGIFIYGQHNIGGYGSQKGGGLEKGQSLFSLGSANILCQYGEFSQCRRRGEGTLTVLSNIKMRKMSMDVYEQVLIFWNYLCKKRDLAAHMYITSFWH